MPLPAPRGEEEQDDFISRCVEWVMDNDEAEDSEQAAAICHEQWRDAKEEKAMDNALKAISRTDDELRVGNYIVLFGGRDLEGEYFTPETQIESRFTKAGRLPLDWEHRQAPEGRDPGTLGFVDWSTAKAQDLGVWVERVLDRRNAYVKWIEELIDEGLVGTSSEADPRDVQKGEDGRITRWPLMGDTLTVTPMEPRMLSENVLQAAKSLGLIEEVPEPEAEAEAQQGAEAGKAVDDDANGTSVDANEQERAALRMKRIDMVLEG